MRVHTNDPALPEFSLTMAGPVERFAEITPGRVVLAGYVGESIRQTVTIRPTAQHPFQITSIRAANGQHLRINLDQTDLDDSPAYVVTIENTRAESGRYVDRLILKTDSDLQPEIRLGVNVFIRPAGSRYR